MTRPEKLTCLTELEINPVSLPHVIISAEHH